MFIALEAPETTSSVRAAWNWDMPPRRGFCIFDWTTINMALLTELALALFGKYYEICCNKRGA